MEDQAVRPRAHFILYKTASLHLKIPLAALYRTDYLREQRLGASSQLLWYFMACWGLKWRSELDHMTMRKESHWEWKGKTRWVNFRHLSRPNTWAMAWQRASAQWLIEEASGAYLDVEGTIHIAGVLSYSDSIVYHCLMQGASCRVWFQAWSLCRVRRTYINPPGAGLSG